MFIRRAPSRAKSCMRDFARSPIDRSALLGCYVSGVPQVLGRFFQGSLRYVATELLADFIGLLFASECPAFRGVLQNFQLGHDCLLELAWFLARCLIRPSLLEVRACNEEVPARGRWEEMAETTWPDKCDSAWQIRRFIKVPDTPEIRGQRILHPLAGDLMPLHGSNLVIDEGVVQAADRQLPRASRCAVHVRNGIDNRDPRGDRVVVLPLGRRLVILRVHGPYLAVWAVHLLARRGHHSASGHSFHHELFRNVTTLSPGGGSTIASSRAAQALSA